MEENKHSGSFGALKALAFLPLVLLGAGLWYYLSRNLNQDAGTRPAPAAVALPSGVLGARSARLPGSALPSMKLEIKGSPAFVRQVKQALKLVWDADRNTGLFLESALYEIKNENKTDFYMDNGHPVATISKAHAFRSRTWCAGIIAHQAWHAWYTHKTGGKKVKAPPRPGKENRDKLVLDLVQFNYKGLDVIFELENRASTFQLEVLRQVGAPAAEIKQVLLRAPRDFTTGHDGSYSLKP